MQPSERLESVREAVVNGVALTPQLAMSGTIICLAISVAATVYLTLSCCALTERIAVTRSKLAGISKLSRKSAASVARPDRNGPRLTVVEGGSASIPRLNR